MKENNEKRGWKNLLFALLVALAVVSFWRGIWGLMDLYLYPNDLLLSFAISSIIGIIILYSIKNHLDHLI